MRRIALFLFPLLLLACSKKDQAGTQVTVTYTPSFKKGCLKLLAEDSAKPELKAEQVLTGPELQAKTSPLKVAVLRREGWGPKAKVTVMAHERDCDGQLVNQGVVEVEFGEEGFKSNTTYSVTLVTPDGDGDGYVAKATDDASRPGGSDCQDSGTNADKRFPDNREECDLIDNNCDDVVDENLTKNWYLDDDQDGFPRESSPVVQCPKPAGNYIEYAAGKPFDCNDDPTSPTAATINPDATERCDGIDNNCVGGVDEGFAPIGVSCNAECNGVTQCSADGREVVCSREEGKYYYPDRDRDGDGAAGSATVLKCEDDSIDGFVLNNHGDCDDLDPARSLLRGEICDAIDNDCDGDISDEPPSCGGSLKRVPDYHLSSDNQRWNTVSVHPTGYPVWVAGEDGKLAVRKTPTSKFESFSFGDPNTPNPSDGSPAVRPNHCGNTDWRVSWVAANGWVYLAGGSGAIGVHKGTAEDCAVGGTGGSGNVTGIVGFETSGPVPTIYLTDTEGKLFRWVFGTGTTELDDNLVNYYGLHGLQEGRLLAVGSVTPENLPTSQQFRSYLVTPNGGASATMHTSTPSDVAGNAKAVWMGSATNACAVGENAAVWRWSGETTWNKVGGLGGLTAQFTSVVMRNDPEGPQNSRNGHAYIVDGVPNGSRPNPLPKGKLRRLTPYDSWGAGPDLPSDTADVPLSDLAFSETGEFWVVGEKGRVFHYPEP